MKHLMRSARYRWIQLRRLLAMPASADCARLPSWVAGWGTAAKPLRGTAGGDAITSFLFPGTLPQPARQLRAATQGKPVHVSSSLSCCRCARTRAPSTSYGRARSPPGRSMQHLPAAGPRNSRGDPRRRSYRA